MEVSWSAIAKKPQAQKPQGVAVEQVFETCKSSKGIAVAVVDANAVIHGGESLMSFADKFVSVAEVMEEIRDPVSRHRLDLLPFTVEIMEPSPESLRTVVNFARATGDLQTLSDVDLKLIALAYTLEAQIHGVNHLRDTPPPIHLVNVRMLTEKEMPGWGNNVPNLEEWEALEQVTEADSNTESRILPLKDLNLNVIPMDDQIDSRDVSENGCEVHSEDMLDVSGSLRGPRRFKNAKKEINIDGKKMVADGIDASQGEVDDNADDWRPAVSRSTHRRYLRRKAKRESSETLSEKGDDHDMGTNVEMNVIEENESVDVLVDDSEKKPVANKNLEDGKTINGDIGALTTNIAQMRLEAESISREEEELCMAVEGEEACDSMVVVDASNNSNAMGEGDSCEPYSVDDSFIDDNSSEQSWMLKSLSESTVACITSDFAMQNVILQIGLRLLAPGGMQIRQLHRWILKCHACNKVTAEIGRIFCPKCGNGGTLRKVAVTVGENGIVLAARRPRVTLRGTKFSLPLPQGGRDAIAKNLILREDQLPQKLLYPKTKKKVNKEGDDIFSSDNIFGHNLDKRAPWKPPVRKALAVFSGKRNPNDNHYSRSKH
ncbi:hypothetical protein Scep_018690 [Stephania cephalantha]|uniref:RNA-binding protein NOB1 n=1 Tax=Stephania cephalantha TaxID=152367 RepID=A0AAP0I9D8_9MAGN